MTNPNTIAYGVELETIMPAAKLATNGGDVQRGRYHNGTRNAWTPNGQWKAESDGSLRPRFDRQETGVEFVSPVMKGEDGLRQIKTMTDAIKSRGGRVNASCGIHVTVTFNGNAQQLARLVCLFANYENAIYATTGSRQRQDRHYSKGIKRYNGHQRAETNAKSDRYHGLNLTHVARGNNRVEFRVFCGSLNANKIKGHVLMCLALVQLAMDSDRNISFNKRGKQTETGKESFDRLLNKIGWKPRYAAQGKRLGNVDGVSETEWKTIVKTCWNMTKKYDGAA